jgi:hypothetical protein
MKYLNLVVLLRIVNKHLQQIPHLGNVQILNVIASKEQKCVEGQVLIYLELSIMQKEVYLLIAKKVKQIVISIVLLI